MIPDGWHWNQAELESGHPLNNALLSILVITECGPEPIGTAFFVTANGNHATAISAAHCFEEIRKKLNPNQRHHPSALPEFLPPLAEIGLENVKALYLKDGHAYTCSVEFGIWDPSTDLAIFEVTAPAGKATLFEDFFWLDDEVPKVGEQVAMIGYGEMKTRAPARQGEFTIQRSLLLRLDRVEEVYPEGHYLLKGPHIQTSIAVYSGMSGGVVARYKPNEKIKPFGFISHAPDPQPSLDRSKTGQSIAATLNVQIFPQEAGGQIARFKIYSAGLGKDQTKSQPLVSFGISETES